MLSSKRLWQRKSREIFFFPFLLLDLCSWNHNLPCVQTLLNTWLLSLFHLPLGVSTLLCIVSLCWITWFFSFMKIFLCIIQDRWFIENFLPLMVQLVIHSPPSVTSPFMKISGFQTLICIGISKPHLQSVSQWVWSEAQEFAFLRSCKVMLMLLIWGPRSGNSWCRPFLLRRIFSKDLLLYLEWQQVNLRSFD